jgi:hypothetical protein
MPQVRKLAPEEVRTLERKSKGQRRLTAEEYDRYLAEFNVGDWGEVELLAGEKRLTVRNRLKAAAERRNIKLDFRRTTGNLLRFKVLAADAAQDDGRVQGHERAVGDERGLQSPTGRRGRRQAS